MNEELCLYCGEPIPEGRQICARCDRELIKLGTLLQSSHADQIDVERAYEWLFGNIDDVIDMT